MNTTRFFQHSAVILLTLAMLITPMSATNAATTEYTSYLLGRIQWQTIPDFADAQRGGLQVLGAEANSKWGFYHVRSVKNGCQWKFSWKFSEDVTRISYSRGEIAATFQIESNGGTCSTDFNPFVEFRTDGDPTTPVYGPNRELEGRFCLREGGNCNQKYAYRKFKVYRETSWRETPYFSINFFGPNFGGHSGYGHHALSIVYQYQGQTGGSGPVPPPTSGLAGTQWQECETYSQAICGYWTRGADGRWSGQWGGVQADLSVTVNGRDVTVTRRDRTSSLQATYRGTLSSDGTQITGRVDWYGDSLGARSGTWRAQILGVRR